MTDLAGKNPSTLKALRGPTGKMCRGCCFAFSSDDCCCFLNPDTPPWDDETLFTEGQLCTDDNKTYESLQNGNLNHLTSDGDWWLLVSNTTACGNANWDEISPFGGPGKTPFLYKVVVANCMPADITAKKYVRPNGTYILQQEGSFLCRWSGNNGNYWSTTENSDCLGIRVKLFTRISQWGYKTIFNLFMWGPDVNSQTLMLALGTVHQLDGLITDDGLQSWPGNSKTYTYGTDGATVTITPISGIISSWILGELYPVDRIAKNRYGNWFICILEHTSTEDDEPGVGVNWPTYWEEADNPSALIFGGNLVWDIEPFTKCEFSDGLQMTLVVPDDVVDYESEEWEYKFLICDDDYVTTYDSDWQSSPSFTATGLPECNPDGSGSARYGYITARARLKNFPLVATCSAPRKIVIMKGGAWIYQNNVAWYQGFQDGDIDCGHVHVGYNDDFVQFWDPPTQPGGQIKVLIRVRFGHFRGEGPIIYGNWYESGWLNENEFWETPEDCAGDPEYRFTGIDIKRKLRNACGDGDEDWDW